jgi:hypothetical protein
MSTSALRMKGSIASAIDRPRGKKWSPRPESNW